MKIFLTLLFILMGCDYVPSLETQEKVDSGPEFVWAITTPQDLRPDEGDALIVDQFTASAASIPTTIPPSSRATLPLDGTIENDLPVINKKVYSQIQWVTMKEARQRGILKQPIIAFVTTDNCMACELSKTAMTDQKVVDAAKLFVFFEDKNRGFSWGVSSYPALVFVSPEWTILERAPCPSSVQNLVTLLQRWEKKWYELSY